MLTIKIMCPDCNKNIDIEIDKNFQIISVRINDVELSSKDQLEALKQLGIEFG